VPLGAPCSDAPPFRPPANQRRLVFEVLAIDGRAVHRRPYWERRRLLEQLDLLWQLLVDHAELPKRRALWERVITLGLGGVVGKRSCHYLPGRRGWIKRKNRDYWRYPFEVAAVSLAPVTGGDSALADGEGALHTGLLVARYGAVKGVRAWLKVRDRDRGDATVGDDVAGLINAVSLQCNVMPG
jgi:hypothetical protein